MKWFKKVIDNLADDRPVQTVYGIVPAYTARKWAEEDAAFARMASAMLDASSRGVDVSFMRDCPDLHAHARENF